MNAELFLESIFNLVDRTFHMTEVQQSNYLSYICIMHAMHIILYYTMRVPANVCGELCKVEICPLPLLSGI